MNRFVRGNSLTCIGCRTCMIGCVVSHEGLKIFQMEPDGYVFNPKLDIIKTAAISIAVQCKHCENPACLNACPVGAIVKTDDVIVVRQDKCIGCKTCMVACPYGAINMVSHSSQDGRIVANKCDLCINEGTDPVCVKVCPTRSLTMVTEDKLSESNSNKRKTAAKNVKQGG